ncbi:hypothetical protein [Halobacteriovorax sp. HLS]|uniref:hypothetical protein n=1 Tax=Halobacteriovorax sp. HLS TaxID=2234000 RepID=UPI000FD7505D|nr:hypothetical protein [Halobacteriovorax sp. HLS]
MEAIKILNEYLPNLSVEQEEILIKGLPVFIKHKYEFSQIIINKVSYLLVTLKDKAYGPRELKKHMKIISSFIDLQIIWYFKELHFNKVQRMIQNGENFIVENKQVHLPIIGTSLKKHKEKKVSTEKLNGLAENLLIREILKGDISGKSKRDIAKEFNVTEMTMGRAINRLLANDLCYEQKENTSKLVSFYSRGELWDFLRRKVESPAKEEIGIEKKPKGLPLSGISALSKLTMLAEDDIPTYAISKKEFIKKYDQEVSVFKDFAKVRIQLWNREPILLKKGVINPLDIYLIHKDDRDERVQIELEKLLGKIGFEIRRDDD